MSNIFPELMFKQMVPAFSNLSYNELKSSVLDQDIDEIQRMNKRQRSGDGFLIDLSQTKEITSKNLQAIPCPTLIMHSEFDGSVPLEHAYYADQQIRDSELCILDTWGHLIWLGRGSGKVNERLVKFLNNFSL